MSRLLWGCSHVNSSNLCWQPQRRSLPKGHAWTNTSIVMAGDQEGCLVEPDLRQRLAVGLDVVGPPQDHGHCLGPHPAVLLLLHL